jgi:preprotein translocase subunit Sec63
MGKEKNEKEIVMCPVGRFFQDLEKAAGKKSEFTEHMTQACIEFLKAIRSLADERIKDFEKKDSAKGKKKATKIKVE